ELAEAKKQLTEHQTAQNALSKQFANSEKQQAELQAKLRQQEQNYVTAQAQLKQANTDLQKLKNEVETKTALMNQASDQQVKALTADLNKQLALLKQKEDGLKKAETESKVTREALAKQQADAKALAEKNQQLVTQLKQKAQQADKIQASLAEQTAKLAQKITLESELATAKKQLAEQQAAQNVLSKQYVESQKQQQQLQENLKQNEQNFVNAQKQLEQANAELLKLQKDVEKQTALVGQASDKQVKALTADLNKQVTLLKEKESAIAKLESEKKSISDALAAQESEKKKLDQQNQQFTKQTKAQEDKISKLESDIAAKTKKQSEIEQKLTDTNKLLGDLKANSQKELALAQEKLKKLQTELDSSKSISSDEALKSQIMALNRQITQLQNENDALKARGGSKSSTGLAGRIPPSKDAKVIAAENAKKNQKIIEQITAQKYSKLDSNTYYKIIQVGSPIKDVKNKDVTFIMREQLTDGKVTVLYTDQNPVTLPYNQLPAPLNSFVERAGEGGMVKVYIKPEGGYGVEGIPGEVPPNSMSIIDLKIIKAK
ncbi:hypothetical protein, partial [Providencia rettgeri]